MQTNSWKKSMFKYLFLIYILAFSTNVNASLKLEDYKNGLYNRGEKIVDYLYKDNIRYAVWSNSPDWKMNSRCSEVPIPTAFLLFSSGLLGVLITKR